MNRLMSFATAAALLLYAAAAGASSDRININQADAERLQSLNGVGPATAEAIIEDRAANGPYAQADQLVRVNGIGEATLEAIRDRITVE